MERKEVHKHFNGQSDNLPKTRKVRKPIKIKPSLSPQEMHKIFNRSKMEYTKDKYKFRNFVIIKCLIYFGLRESELQNLKIEDILFSDGKILVNEGKGKKDRYIGFYNLKLDDTSIEETLKQFIGKRTEGYLLKGNDSKGRISTTEIYRIISDYKKMQKGSIVIIEGLATRAGIKKHTTPHTFRRSLGDFLFSIGVPKPTIQNILGHSKIDTTTLYIKNTIQRDSNEVNKALVIKNLHAELPIIESELASRETTLEVIRDEIKLNRKLFKVFLGLD